MIGKRLFSVQPVVQVRQRKNRSSQGLEDGLRLGEGDAASLRGNAAGRGRRKQAARAGLDRRFQKEDKY